VLTILIVVKFMCHWTINWCCKSHRDYKLHINEATHGWSTVSNCGNSRASIVYSVENCGQIWLMQLQSSDHIRIAEGQKLDVASKIVGRVFKRECV